MDRLILEYLHLEDKPPKNINSIEYLVSELNAIREMLNDFKEELKPVIKFHTSSIEEPKKRLTGKQKLQLEVEERKKLLQLESLNRIKNGLRN